MTASMYHSSVHAVRDAAHALTGAPSDFEPLLGLVGDAHYVLVGAERGGGSRPLRG